MNEEVSRDMTGEADGMNQAVDSSDGVRHRPIPNKRSVILMRRWLVGEKG